MSRSPTTAIPTAPTGARSVSDLLRAQLPAKDGPTHPRCAHRRLWLHAPTPDRCGQARQRRMERSHRLVGGHQDERPHRLTEHAIADVEQTRQRLTARVLGVRSEVLARVLEDDDTPALRPSRGSARVGDRIEEVARVREELLRIGHELELRPGAPLARERSDRVGLAGAGLAVPEHETSARRAGASRQAAISVTLARVLST